MSRAADFMADTADEAERFPAMAFQESPIILLVLRREWMGMGVAGMIIDSSCGSFPHSLRSAQVIGGCHRIFRKPRIDGKLGNGKPFWKYVVTIICLAS
jgi:hypothetical protein